MTKPVIQYGFDDFADISNVAAEHVTFRASKIDEPITIKETFNEDHSKQWKVAADGEYQSLMKNNTWELVKLPEGRKVIGYTWVFRVKYDGKGQVERFKGRQVAKGYCNDFAQI